ncbi:HD domain-containing phosphohydrolase [Proteinivorax tanatarense]|uniref:HD domain-containing phosphohydrolase n=1 Tax=Proteinivorax tanatarense TaxID=1260629 RepID=A0AAU7VPH8_9FIRM
MKGVKKDCKRYVISSLLSLVVKGEDFIVFCFGKPVFDNARQHHERLDGSGYPDGLTDKEISKKVKSSLSVIVLTP